MTRRLLLLAAVAALASGCADERVAQTAPAADRAATASAPESSPAPVVEAAARDTVVLYKTPSCGCCRLWGDHMTGEGFAVVSRDVDDLQAVKDSLRVPTSASSCHTATVGGYVVEGHVPAAQVRRLLRDRPDAHGLAVPGMPIGSPGMEQGPTRDAYDVLLVGADGATTVYDHIPGTASR